MQKRYEPAVPKDAGPGHPMLLFVSASASCLCRMAGYLDAAVKEVME